MTDNELYRKMKMFGKNSLLWRRKFEGLLPEAHRRRLFEKKGFGSIFEMAFKMCGLSEKQVRMILGLEKRFESLPELHGLLVDGVVSPNKLVRVAAIATPENQEVLAEQVQKLSQKAVEVLVKDFKSENGLGKPQNRPEVLRAQNFVLSDEVSEKLSEMHARGHDVNELFLEFLRERAREIEDEKDEVAASLPEASSRYVPERVKVVLRKEFGDNCAIWGCPKKAEVIHHTARFSLSRRHDPHFLAPLCRGHHEIAHAVDLKVVEMRL